MKNYIPENIVEKNTIICSHCGKDTKISKILYMVIPESGLKCPHCGNVVVHSTKIRYFG